MAKLNEGEKGVAKISESGKGGVGGIEGEQNPQPLAIAVLTISDTRELATDKSGDWLQKAITEAGHKIVAREIVKDDRDAIYAKLLAWREHVGVSVVITTGGTGITARDVTPEVVRGLLDKELGGFGELFRQLSYEKIGASSIQSRAIGGVMGKTLLFALPGSPSACMDAWRGILKQQLDIRTKPCNFVELLPRL